MNDTLFILIKIDDQFHMCCLISSGFQSWSIMHLVFPLFWLAQSLVCLFLANVTSDIVISCISQLLPSSVLIKKENVNKCPEGTC